MENHVSRDQICSFMRGDLPHREARDLVSHLLTGCDVCRRTLHDPYSSEDYDRAFAGLVTADDLQHAVAVMNLRGMADWSTLEPLPQGQRLMFVCNKSQFQHLGLYNRLLELTREAAWEDPKRGVDLAHLAVAVANHLSTTEYGEARVADFQAAAHAALGNAHRIDADYVAAREELDNASELLQKGTGDPLEEYNLLSMSASLLINLGRYSDAYVVLGRAIRKARSVGDSIAEATALIQQADSVGHVEPLPAIPLLKRALSLLGENDDWLRLGARHNLAWFLTAANRPLDAIRILDATRPLYARFPHTVPTLWRHWLEGRIAHKLGELGTAEQILQKVWDDFYQAGFGHHLPILSIDLAEVLADGGETDRAVTLLTETYTVMCSWRMDIPALAAIVAIRDTVARGAATDSVFSEARLTFRRGFATDGDPDGA